MNPNIFCARKGGVTIHGKFCARNTSEILAKQIERRNNKLEARQKKRDAKLGTLRW